MPYYSAIHRCPSICLKDYDYAQAGMFFVTICVNVGADLRVCPDDWQFCQNLFGNVDKGAMILNNAGHTIILGEHIGSPLQVVILLTIAWIGKTKNYIIRNQ